MKEFCKRMEKRYHSWMNASEKGLAFVLDPIANCTQWLASLPFQTGLTKKIWGLLIIIGLISSVRSNGNVVNYYALIAILLWPVFWIFALILLLFLGYALLFIRFCILYMTLYWFIDYSGPARIVIISPLVIILVKLI